MSHSNKSPIQSFTYVLSEFHTLAILRHFSMMLFNDIFDILVVAKTLSQWVKALSTVRVFRQGPQYIQFSLTPSLRWNLELIFRHKIPSLQSLPPICTWWLGFRDRLMGEGTIWHSKDVGVIFYDILDWCIARGLLILSLNVNVLFSGGSALSFCIGPATQTQPTLSTYLMPAVIVWCAGKVLRTSPTLQNSTASLIARLQEDHSALQRERDAFEEEKVGFACNIHSPGRYRRKTVETESW